MMQPLFLGSIGMPELIIILLIVLLLFGAKKIPELMSGLGKGVKSFKKGMKEVEDEIEKIDTDISDDTKETKK
jgi:sec-independent protein translocase protein TatA